MAIFLESDDALEHMFISCTTDQINEFIPEKRGFRIHGHSTTVRLERAFWNVLDEMASERDISTAALIQKIHNQCIVANEKNIASCLRVICLKYINIYG